ncbi:MAG: hypothetical protein JW384_02791 [Nitrosomonadaceae bacterium]|nr:hypothetical protein [Nitrosomonadaceae bacterium]
MAQGMLVDTWEGKKSRSWLKTGLLKAGWDEIALEAHYAGADYAWLTSHEKPRRVGLQYKTLYDLLHSYWEGRVQRQLYDLCRSVDIPGLIIDDWIGMEHHGYLTSHGNVVYRDPGRKTGPIFYSAYMNIIMELTGHRPDGVAFDLIQLPGNNKFTLHALSKALPDKYDADSFAGWSRLELPPRHNNAKLQALLGTPGLGEKRARDLLKVYNDNPFSVIEAARKGELVVKGKGVVSGVGRTTQDKMQEVWGIGN